MVGPRAGVRCQPANHPPQSRPRRDPPRSTQPTHLDRRLERLALLPLPGPLSGSRKVLGPRLGHQERVLGRALARLEARAALDLVRGFGVSWRWWSHEWINQSTQFDQPRGSSMNGSASQSIDRCQQPTNSTPSHTWTATVRMCLTTSTVVARAVALSGALASSAALNASTRDLATISGGGGFRLSGCVCGGVMG